MTYDQAELRAELERDEGNRQEVYDDESGRTLVRGQVLKGWPSIGIGRNLLRAGGLSGDEINLLYENDRAACEASLDANLRWWRMMTDARQRALMNLCWSGWGMLATFTTFLSLLESSHYPEAATDLLGTAYARENPERAQRLAEMIRNG